MYGAFTRATTLVASLMLIAGGLGIHATAGNFPDSRFWGVLQYQFSHVQWLSLIHI